MEKFQRALYQHYQAQNAASLYEPTEVKKFAEQNAPGLFNIILYSILRDDPRLIEPGTPYITRKENGRFAAHQSIF